MKTLPFEVDVSEDGRKKTVHFPGITNDMFGSAGIITPWAILKLMEFGRIMTTDVKNSSDAFGRSLPIFEQCVDYDDIEDSKRAMLFVVEQSVEFDWERLLCITRQSKQTCPHSVSCDLETIGRTSFILKQTITNDLDGSCLATGYVTIVVVDSVTRRPKEFPRLYRKKFAHLLDNKVTPARISLPDIPTTTFSLPFSVVYTDLDGNKHLNQATFVKHVFNCVWKANETRTFQHFGYDIGKQPLRNLVALYKGEGREGEQLVSSCWQDATNPRFIHSVVRNNDKVLAYFKMTFDIRSQSKL